MTKHFYADSQRITSREYTSLYWLLTDHLGSTALTANSSGSEYGELRYKAWGETRFTSGSTPTTYRFTGQREDATIQLLFYNVRYYPAAPRGTSSAALGRFIQADTIVPEPGNPQDLNRYSYAANNPLRFSDPSGHWYYDPGCQCLVQTRDSGHNYWTDPVSTRHHSGSRYLNYDETPESSPITPIMPQDGGAAYCAVADCASADGIFGFLLTAAAFAFEPVDWALTFNQWAHGSFSAWDLAGLLPFVSGQVDNVGDALHAVDRAGVDGAGTIIYRGGKPNPGNLTPRPQDMGELSFRDSLSNPWPLPAGESPPLPAGERYFGIDTSQLPPLSVTFDNIPPGHVFVKDVPVEVFKKPGVIVERGKFPK